MSKTEELDFSKNDPKSSAQHGTSGLDNDDGLNCNLCSKIIITDDHISCSSCGNNFHCGCIPNFSLSKDWKCAKCEEKKTRKSILEKCFKCKLSCEEKNQRCHKCKRTFHKSCAGIDGSSAVEVWACESCDEGKTRDTKAKSLNSKKSKSSSRRSAISENLQLLNEEKQLAEEMAKKKGEMLRQEEALLMKKKELLLEEEEQKKSILHKKRLLLETSSTGSSSSRASTVSSAEKITNTENWVSKLPNTNKQKVNLDPNATSFKPQIPQPRPIDAAEQRNNRQSTIQEQLPSKLISSARQAAGENISPSMIQSRQLTKANIQARHATKDLPSFAGSSEEWPLFISAFENTTRECNYSHYENQMRLLTCLKGEAKARVGSMLAYPENVPIVIERLRKMYGQPYQIIDALTRKVRNVPRVRLDRLHTLIDLQTAVMQLCSNIYAANINEHLINPSLVMEIVEKLPPELKLQWGEQLEQFGNANLETLNNWLCFKADSACRVMSFHKPDESEFKEQRPKKPNFVLTHFEKEEQRCDRCEGTCKKLIKCEKFNTDPVVDRWKFVKSKYLCFRCLEPHRSCKDKSICGVDGCSKKHHPLLHESKVSGEAVYTISQEHQNILFRIVPVKLYGSKGNVSTFAYLDEGSSVSLIDDDLIRQLDPNATTKPLCMFWTGKKSHMEENSKTTTIGISGYEQESKVFSIKVRSLKHLSLPSQSLSDDFVQRFEHLKNLPITTYSKAVPKILIGMDNWRLSIPRKLRESQSDNGVAATSTLLGWVVQGRTHSPCEQNYDNVHVHICNCHLDELMERQYNLENFGVNGKDEKLLSYDDKAALQLLELQTSFSNGHYSTGLLWKPYKFKIPDSRPVAVKRLHCLEKRMNVDSSLRVKMSKEIRRYEENHYIKKLSNEEVNMEFDRKWYLPIFPVSNKNKPDKFRIVWDAAAETQGISLNKMQFKGPDLVPLLVGVLLRFREGKFGVSADIAEMFHMIKINSIDHHSQRFLWRESPDQPIDEYAMQVMTFGSCSSPCTAQFVKNRNAEKFVKDSPKAVEAITRDHYVDDFLGSYNNEGEAIKLCREVSKIHESGGFHIRNWVSNSANILRAMSASAEVKGLDFQGDDIFKEKILGMWWVPERDTFTFKLRIDKQNEDVLTGRRCPTKRELLSVLMKIYDPLGLINHFLIFAKVLLKKAWIAEIEWDVEIGEELFTKWLKWLSVLQTFDQLSIPRWHFKEKHSSDVQLHIFCDASKDAYSAVGYFRYKESSSFKCSLVMSKARVAPKRIISIPRLELLAAVLAVRLADIIKKEHSINLTRTVYWSDSKTVVYWIGSRSISFKQFVAFRINEIREKSDPSSWRFVPGRKNVADLSTKWGKVPELTFNHPWFTGPYFLSEAEEHWEGEAVTEIDDMNEVCFCINNTVSYLPSDFKIDVSRFSKWRKLVGAVSYVLRAITPKNCRITGPLLQNELEKAEKIVIRQAQAEVYYNEIITLNESDAVKETSKIAFLLPYLDSEGVVRAYGRIGYSEDLSFEAKHPIILPYNHRVSFLLIDHYHRLYHHVHDNTVVNEINQVFYVHKLRILLRSVRSKCQVCKNKNTKPIAPLMSDIPPSRLQTFTRPFSFIGMDYFGPMVIVIGRRCEKRWGVLITCLTTRAIHIELATSLSSDSCIMALHRFIGRRGLPQEIYTDNATNFHGAENELIEVLKNLDRTKLMEEISSSKLFFIPPCAPHMGGCWERMIRSVKNILYQILPTLRPSHELLSTILIHVENMVNSRPLSYVPVDHNAQEALTPNHFLLGSSNGMKPSGDFTDDKWTLRKNWMEAERQANICWRRFIKEFLPTLTGRSKWQVKAKPIQVGDIVIIIDENSPRNTYPKGIVISTSMGKNEQVRSAKVQTRTGIYTRPVVKLALLDVNDYGGMKDSKDLPTGGAVEL